MSKQLIASREGNTPSFEQLFTNYRNSLVSFARRLVRDEAAAEDLVTELFVKLWEKENDFPNELAAKSYLLTSIRNACLNYLATQRYRRKRTKTLITLTEDHEEPVLNEMIRTEYIQEAWNIIQKLPTECRRIFILGYIKGIPNDKIAQVLNLSKSTVRNQKSNGLRMVKNLYQEYSDKMDQAAVA